MTTTKLIKKAERGDYVTPLTKKEIRTIDQQKSTEDRAYASKVQASQKYAETALSQTKSAPSWQNYVSDADRRAIEDIQASRTDGSGGAPVPQITPAAQARVNTENVKSNSEAFQRNNQVLTALKQFGYKGKLDGILGKGAKAAIAEVQRQGYTWDEGTKNYVQKTSDNASETESPNFFTKAVTGLLNAFSTPAQAQERPINSQDNFQKTKIPTSNSKGRAIYLHYPNFEGKMSNAFKVGNTDVGKEISKRLGITDKLPVGHGETLLVDPNGKVKYVRYGRYTTGTGAVRESVKGGNWGIYDYPDMQPEETTEQYIKRNKGKNFNGQRMFDDSSYGAFEAIDIPDVDYNKALKYATTQANDKNRSEYSLINTCATGATNTIKAGLSTWDKIKTYLPNFSGSDAETAKGSTLWGWLPGSTNSYARSMRNLGSSTIIRKNGGNLNKIIYFQI